MPTPAVVPPQPSADNAEQLTSSSKTVTVCGDNLPARLNEAGSSERFRSLIGVWTGNWSNGVCAGLIISKIAQNGTARVTYTYKIRSRNGQIANSDHQDVTGSVAGDNRLSFHDTDGAHVSFMPKGKNHLIGFYSRRPGRYSETIFEKLL